MITSNEALNIILDNAQDFGTKEVSVHDSLGHVLKEDIVADRDFPPFDRVSMDGIAINYDVYNSEKKTFFIEGIQAAGSPQRALKNQENCFEVMTGAVLPIGTNTVIRYEDVSIEDQTATVTVEVIEKGQNVHLKGKDRSQNDILIRKNTRISAAEIGVLTTVGKSKVKVARQPKVIIISTGDELVDTHEQPLPHQIRRSNVYTLVSLLQQLNIKAESDHITDNKNILTEKIAKYLKEYDVLLFSGAVSKGKFDFLPEVLEELGVQRLFHKVAQRPGKPFWFGVKQTQGMNKEREIEKDKMVHVFAFPGNPVSTFISCLKYFYAWYKKSIEIQYRSLNKAILAEDIEFKPKLTYFMQVKLQYNNGLNIAKPVIGNGSGDLANLVAIDGFLELSAEQTSFKAGEVFPLITFR